MLLPCAARLDASDVLTPVEHMDAIVPADVVPDIDRPAIGVDDGRSRADESRRAGRIEEVCARDQRNQLPNDRIGRRGALLVAEDEAVQVDALALPEALVRPEKESAPAPDRPPSDPPNWFRLNGCGSAEVNSKKFRASSASLRRNSNTSPCTSSVPDRVTMLTMRPRHVSVLGAECRVVDLELLDAGERGLEDQRAEREVVGRHAVDQKADRLLTIAGRVEGERADAANRPATRTRSAMVPPIQARADRDP